MFDKNSQTRPGGVLPRASLCCAAKIGPPLLVSFLGCVALFLVLQTDAARADILTLSDANTPLLNMEPTHPGCEDNTFRLRDLKVELIRIANHDTDQMLRILRTLGYETVSITSGTATETVTREYEDEYGDMVAESIERPMSVEDTLPDAQSYGCDDLPVVVMPPPIDDERLGFDVEDFLGLGSSIVSDDYEDEYSSGVSGDISPALHAMDKPHSGEVDYLLTFYHPDQIEKLRELQKLVRTRLDIQASQVYIEGLVLEVSEDGFQEFGLQYDRTDAEGNTSYSVGSSTTSSRGSEGIPVLNFTRDSLFNTLPNQSILQLQALVSNGSAEVLSRPSVLTLNNRQATIQIIDIIQFPIQEATITSGGDIVQSAFSFQAVRPGITLNLRPRVSADLSFVSLEIDVTVESLVSANSGEVRSESGQVIATKPGTSARRVQTFARIPDRTPIIIGGLIRADREQVNNQVPILSKIPVIGKLFGASRDSIGKREVIIVLTPYVVAEGSSFADVSVPKDTSLFDLDDTELFLDSYRIRAEDVYDLRFLLDSPEFSYRKGIAEQIRDEHPELASQAPFSQFIDGNIPGGDKFLSRMVYDLVRRRGFGTDVTFEKLIVLRNTPSGDPEVALMANLIREMEASPNKAISIVFGKEGVVGQAAELEVGSLPANRSWDELLWERSYGANSKQSAVIIRNREDLKMLEAAVISASVLDRNGGYEKLTVGRFKQGTLLSIPSFDPDRFYLIDEQVARVFTDIRHYYRASSESLDAAYKQMDVVIKNQSNTGVD